MMMMKLMRGRQVMAGLIIDDDDQQGRAVGGSLWGP
jgi:hypothetical protein